MINNSKVYNGFDLIKAFIIIFVGFVCLCLCVMGIGYISMSLSRMKCTEEVNAVVVENVKKEQRLSNDDDYEGDTFAPVFAYTYNDIQYRTKGHTYTHPPKYDVGENVTIKINPDDPEKLAAPEEKNYLFFGILMEAVVVGIIAYGLYYFKSNRKLDIKFNENIGQN